MKFLRFLRADFFQKIIFGFAKNSFEFYFPTLTLNPLTFWFLRIIHSNFARLLSYVYSQIVLKTMVHYSIWDTQRLHPVNPMLFGHDFQKWKNKNSTKFWHFSPLDVYLSLFKHLSNQKLQHCCRVCNLESCEKCRSVNKTNVHVYARRQLIFWSFLIDFDQFKCHKLKNNQIKQKMDKHMWEKK